MFLLLNEWIKPTQTLNFNFQYSICTSFDNLFHSKHIVRKKDQLITFTAKQIKHVKRSNHSPATCKQLRDTCFMKQIPRISIQCTKSTLNSGVDAPLLRFQTFQQIWRKVWKLGGKLSSATFSPIEW